MVISDGGSHFIDKIFWNFLKELSAEHNIATPHHPQTNGQAEASNKQIKNIMQKDGTGDGEIMEDKATRYTLGISDCVQNTIGHVTLSASIRKNMPLACWATTQGTLGNSEIQHGL